MNFIEKQNLKLWSRNEGKLKYYESCTDLRAWSHDLRSRDRYLREWMKCDMPINVLPTAKLLSYMKNVVPNKNWGSVVPRCHPHCKSKTVMESVCKTSAAMKGCLRQDDDFQKYFDQEEFETSHWPCEKYLEVLKNVRMFWKVITDKIFKIRIPQSELYNDRGDGSLRSLVKNWEKGMIHEAAYVKNITRCSSELDNVACVKICSKQISFKCSKDDIGKGFDHETDADGNFYKKSRCETSTNHTQTPQFVGEGERVNGTQNKRKNRFNNKYVTVKIKTADKLCDSCNFEDDTSELEMYKNKFNYIQHRYNEQKREMENLKNANVNLEAKLEKLEQRKLCHKSTNCCHTRNIFDDWDNSVVKTFTLSPKSCESSQAEENSKNELKRTESEMIITMKSCKNKNYRHISLLQVLHKSNEPLCCESCLQDCTKGHDPAQILNRVKKAFELIVQREMIFVKNKDTKNKLSDINVTFQSMRQSSSSDSSKVTCICDDCK